MKAERHSRLVAALVVTVGASPPACGGVAPPLATSSSRATPRTSVTPSEQEGIEPGPEGSLVPPAACATRASLPSDTGDTQPWWRTYERRPALETFVGRASYYADALAGRRTASGEPYEPAALTAAHRSLPFGTVVRVTRLDTGASVVVRINDRGPFGSRTRIVDLSRAAAEALGMVRRGIVEIRLEVLERP